MLSSFDSPRRLYGRAHWQVTHYFRQIQVAVLQLEDGLAVGDRVRFVRHGYTVFEQDVASMQIHHQFIQSARAGQEIALKVEDDVAEGTEVYRL